MKYISVCVAATVIIAYLCILETSALPSSETQVDEPSNNEALPEMELTETSQELPSRERRCRFCCNCCPGMRGCGMCCRW
ncbi:hepcidin-like [Chanos chanos]|uniref:Hepcidin-like n=1 Tax=Chanos chanos TaxID=29144 RepID=A0A6J2W4P8_CHACN|nr:hepcidin-like [Chanos chanos]